MGTKANKIRLLEEEKAELEYDIHFLEERIVELKSQFNVRSPKPIKKNLAEKFKEYETKYSGDVSFDFWPLSDWVRLELKKWKPGQYFQLCIGPLRIEWYAS